MKDFYNNLYSKEAVFGDTPSGFVSQIPDILKTGKVIDIGSGQGRDALYLARRGFEVTALDNSEIALKNVEEISKKENLPVKTNLLDLTTSFPDIADYSAVIISFVLQHLLPDRGQELLDHIQKNSKPGCLHAISLFTSEGDFLYPNASKKRFYPEPGTLKKIYRDWDIIDYTEELSDTHDKKEDGTLMQKLKSFILAKKK